MIVGFTVSNFIHPQTDWSDYSPDPTKRSEWATGVAFIRANDFETVRNSFFLGRAICIPFILLGGYFGYRFSRELFGEAAGFVFLILWTFSPFILGWGATICPDVTAAAVGIIALYTFWHWLKKQTWLLTLLAGITFGFLPLTKLTWIIAFGLFPIFWLLTSRKKIGQLTVILTIAIFVLNLGYFFDGSFKRLGDYTFHSASLTNENSINKFTGTWLGSIPVPLPEQFILGFDTQRIDFEQGISSYLLGQHSQHGWWYYYFVVLGTKETLGTLILMITAIPLFFFARFRSTWQNEVILLVPLVTLFGVVSSQTGFSLHSRYVIPALPLFYIWISRTGILLSSRFLVVRVVVPTLLLLGTISSLCVYPYSMSYFNEAVGGSPQGHRYLLGSNIDWGQDLYELREWLDEHPEVRPLHVVISHIYPLETLDIRSAGTPPKWRPNQKPIGTWDKQLTLGPQPGWYLLGTNDLYNANHEYDWFHELTPVQRIGYSLFIFHVTLDDANRLRELYDLPKLIEEDFK
jgi:hypothetical protein